jgi:hypothetical protein
MEERSELTNSFRIGLASGFAVLLLTTIVLLPASFVMNHYIYHHPVMRLLLGILGGIGSIFTLLFIALFVMSGKWKRAHYFGLFPLFQSETTSSSEGYFAFLFRIFDILKHPFHMNMTTPDDMRAFTESVVPLLLPEPLADEKTFGGIPVRHGAVSETFFSMARKIGAAPNETVWKKAMAHVESSGIGEYLFTPLPSSP